MQDDEMEALRKVVTAIHWISDEIAITNVVSANNAEVLETLGIFPGQILCLDRKSQARYGLDGRQVVSLVDGDNPAEDFTRAVDALEGMIRRNGRTLVHCHAGRSRSLVVVAGYLVRHRNFTPEDALNLVKSKRPCASIMPGLLKNLHNLPKK